MSESTSNDEHAECNEHPAEGDRLTFSPNQVRQGSGDRDIRKSDEQIGRDMKPDQASVTEVAVEVREKLRRRGTGYTPPYAKTAKATNARADAHALGRLAMRDTCLVLGSISLARCTKKSSWSHSGVSSRAFANQRVNTFSSSRSLRAGPWGSRRNLISAYNFGDVPIGTHNTLCMTLQREYGDTYVPSPPTLICSGFVTADQSVG